MQIPKIIHQTWKTDNVPADLSVLAETWKVINSNWDYKLWTDVDNRKFVEENYPKYLNNYDAFPTNIQRADLIRYMILFKYGGVYVDLDFECFRNIDSLLANFTCVIPLEPDDHCEMHACPSMICNAFMASVPGHSFMEFLIEKAIEPVENYLNPNLLVMDTTGPFMMTRAYNLYPTKEQVALIDSRHVFPLTRVEVLELLFDDNNLPRLQVKLESAYAVHYWMNSWLK